MSHNKREANVFNPGLAAALEKMRIANQSLGSAVKRYEEYNATLKAHQESNSGFMDPNEPKEQSGITQRGAIVGRIGRR